MKVAMYIHMSFDSMNRTSYTFNAYVHPST
jgi:hypothetical protein